MTLEKGGNGRGDKKGKARKGGKGKKGQKQEEKMRLFTHPLPLLPHPSFTLVSLSFPQRFSRLSPPFQSGEKHRRKSEIRVKELGKKGKTE